MRAGSLVPCTPSTCPFAESVSRGVHGQVLVNLASYSANSAVLAAFNRLAPPLARTVAYQFQSLFASAVTNTLLVRTRPRSSDAPWRRVTTPAAIAVLCVLCCCWSAGRPQHQHWKQLRSVPLQSAGQHDQQLGAVEDGGLLHSRRFQLPGRCKEDAGPSKHRSGPSDPLCPGLQVSRAQHTLPACLPPRTNITALILSRTPLSQASAGAGGPTAGQRLLHLVSAAHHL